MTRRLLEFITLIASVTAAAGQTPGAAKAAPGSKHQVPRTSDGKPDLQGIWNNSTITPLERPAEFAGKPFLTPREAADFEKRRAQANDADRRESSAAADVATGYNNAWYDRGTHVVGARATSLITDPSDGLIPPLTPQAQQRLAAARAAALQHPADGPEDRSLTERCMTRGLPIVPGPYNNNIQIVQTPEYVAMFIETMHEGRMIHIDPSGPGGRRPHLPENVRLWMGDSRGHWEGDTLVIDTTNFSPHANFRGSGAGLHLTERLRREDQGTLRYEFTVDDPSTFTKPWTAVVPMLKTDGPIFEYACNEGNYGMTGILGGARAAEAAAAKASK